MKNRVLFIICCLYLGFMLLLAGNTEAAELVAYGHGAVFKPADQFSLTVGVITEGTMVEKALAENSAKMNQIITELKNIGLDEKDYRTARFTVRPLYSSALKPVPSDWRAEIIGYEVENKLTIKTEKVKMAGQIIDLITAAKANSIDNIYFGIKDPGKYRKEAIELAAKNAIEEAKILAAAAGVELEKISALSIEPSSSPFPGAKTALFARSQSFDSTPIEGGDVEIRSTVKVTYDIK